jgi:biuret amidohydrolase
MYRFCAGKTEKQDGCARPPVIALQRDKPMVRLSRPLHPTRATLSVSGEICCWEAELIRSSHQSRDQAMRNRRMNRRDLLMKGGAVGACAVGTNVVSAEEQVKQEQAETTVKVEAEPYVFVFQPASTALVIIDMQRDFVMPGGFGELLGNDVTKVQPAIKPTQHVLEIWRKKGYQVLHTREGHRPDLSDCPPSKKARGNLKVGIGDKGPMGRVLVRGERGHDIIDELKPIDGEPVIDKPGKGAFFATDLDLILKNRGIRSLIVTGVTTEVCVQTTTREANDRGYECLVLEDCVGSYFPEFQRIALAMIKAQGGIVGWVSQSEKLLNALG